MPPLPLYPNAPMGSPDVNWPSMVGSPTYVAASDSNSSDDPYSAWFNSPVGQAWNTAQVSAAAYARKQADAEMANKKRQLDTQVAQLKQQGRYQEAQIALQKGEQEIAKARLAQELQIHQDDLALRQQDFGLSRAKAEADFLSGPDTMFQRADFEGALSRAGVGLGPTPYGSTGTPTPRSPADFEALLAGQNPYPTSASGVVPGPTTQALSSSDSLTGSGQLAPASATDGGGSATGQTDPRVTAASGVLKALAPSDGHGIDPNDAAALGAIQNIFMAAKPGTLQRMRPGQQAAFGSGLKRLGYYLPDALAELQNSAPNQQSVRRAA
jgi:hypothetical protein